MKNKKWRCLDSNLRDFVLFLTNILVTGVNNLVARVNSSQICEKSKKERKIVLWLEIIVPELYLLWLADAFFGDDVCTFCLFIKKSLKYISI